MHFTEERGSSLTMTIDPGVSDNVISELLAPLYLARHRQGAEGGSGTQQLRATPCPKGEKEVKFCTSVAHYCMLAAQVVVVQIPLMSVSHICDVEHRAICTRTRAYHQHEETGRTTGLYREDNVYRMDVETTGSASHFTWQAKQGPLGSPSLPCKPIGTGKASGRTWVSIWAWMRKIGRNGGCRRC